MLLESPAGALLWSAFFLLLDDMMSEGGVKSEKKTTKDPREKVKVSIEIGGGIWNFASAWAFVLSFLLELRNIMYTSTTRLLSDVAKKLQQKGLAPLLEMQIEREERREKRESSLGT